MARGQSWSAGGAYFTLTTSPNLRGSTHDRRTPGENHLAFKGGAADRVDAIIVDAREHGWRQLYQERYPHGAGGASRSAALTIVLLGVGDLRA